MSFGSGPIIWSFILEIGTADLIELLSQIWSMPVPLVKTQ